MEILSADRCKFIKRVINLDVNDIFYFKLCLFSVVQMIILNFFILIVVT